MMRKSGAVLAVLVGMTAWLAASATPVSALSLTGDYFVLGGSHPDTLGGVDGAVVAGLVNGNLSPGAAPTYTGVVPAGSGAIHDLSAPCVPGPCGQIQWWTAHGAGATGVSLQTAGQHDVGTGTSFLPTSFATNFFTNGPAGSDGGANGFRSVHWSGSFHATGLVDLALTSDDDAWLFIRSSGAGNYSLLLDSGGVKAIGITDPVHQTHLGLAAGDYDIQLFFADRHVVQSGITFECTTHEGPGGGSCIDPVPEPTTLLLLGSTLAGLGTVVRRRMKSGKELA